MVKLKSPLRNITCLFLAFFSHLGIAQIQINELVSSNSTILDEMGDTPDWFELHNTSNNPINLAGWTISDKISVPDKWTFPEISIPPDGYLLAWASGKDILSVGYPRTLVTLGDTFKYLVPSEEPASNWTTMAFDDSSWSDGNSGFGYGDGDDATIIPSTLSVYTRIHFSIAELPMIQQMILDIDYDDAFVAYINGVEIARANINGDPPAFNNTAIAGREAQLYNGGAVERYVLTDPSSLLLEGDNILSIQTHNVSAGSSDLSCIPFLSIVSSSPLEIGITPPELLQLRESYLHTNFKLSSSGETMYLRDMQGLLVDSLQFPVIPSDVSFGTSENGLEDVVFTTPTPGMPNTGTSFIGRVNTEVVFSHPGGATGVLNLSLGGVSAPEEIRYTQDGTVPTQSSQVYTSPISITQNSMVRAAVFRNGYLPSPIYTKSYLVNQIHSLPIISLVTDPLNFFDSENGIYVLGDDYTGNFPYFGSNIWEDWEKPIHFSLYEPDGTLGIEMDAGVKIFGGWSRANDQRSLSLFARGKYGPTSFDYPFFSTLPYSSFQGLVLRNSGNDWLNTMLRDGTLSSMMQNTDLEIQAFRPAVTYLNGEFWGIYNIREKINEHYLASRGQVASTDITLLESSGNPIVGSNLEYLQLINFVNSNDLSLEENYALVEAEIDIDNFILYNVAQIYFDNTDWPGNNIKYWKHTNGKWRWILFDTDFGFGIWNRDNYAHNTLAFALDADGPGWPNPPWSTLLFRKLMENQEFRNKFVNRFADEINSRFLVQNVTDHIDSVANGIRNDVTRHYERWGSTSQAWDNNVANMKYFGSNRPASMKVFIRDQLSLESIYEVTLSNSSPDDGYVKLNSLTIKEENWQGDYYKHVPITVTAVPLPGYTFSHWSGSIDSTEPSITIDLSGATSIVANFIEREVEGEPLVINEINYNSGTVRNTGDWVELYNPNSDFMDISGWVLKDNDDLHSFVFPSGTVMEGKGYLVVIRDEVSFNEHYSFLSNVVGQFDYGLASTGDAVRLYDDSENLVDEVVYEPTAPWPLEANGLGGTLELLNPSYDNAQAASWASLRAFGSPGRSNFVISGLLSDSERQLLEVYPNPFSSKTTFKVEVDSKTIVTLALYSINGKLIRPIFDGVLNSGVHEFNQSFDQLPLGIYLLKYQDGKGRAEVLKTIKTSR